LDSFEAQNAKAYSSLLAPSSGTSIILTEFSVDAPRCGGNFKNWVVFTWDGRSLFHGPQREYDMDGPAEGDGETSRHELIWPVEGQPNCLVIKKITTNWQESGQHIDRIAVDRSDSYESYYLNNGKFVQLTEPDPFRGEKDHLES